MSLGRLRLGVRAVATDSQGQERDVSGLVAWSVADPTLASVGQLGALRALGIGSTTVVASLAAANLSASLPISVTPYPVVSPLAVHGVTSASALVSFTTDDFCPLSAVLVQEVGGPGPSLHFGRGDPAGKQHVVLISGLASGKTYQVIPAALSRWLLVGLGPRTGITTP